MAIRKIEQREIRKIVKVGYGRSFGITLPIEFVRKLKWRAGQKLVAKLIGRKIIIKDWEPKNLIKKSQKTYTC